MRWAIKKAMREFEKALASHDKDRIAIAYMNAQEALVEGGFELPKQGNDALLKALADAYEALK